MKSSDFFSPDSVPYPLRNWIHNEKIVGFFLIGIISSVIDIGLLYVFYAYLGVWYIIAAAASYCCGIVASYILNKYLTFHDSDRHYVTQFTTFTAISISCLLVNLCIVWLAVELFSPQLSDGKDHCNALCVRLELPWPEAVYLQWREMRW